MLSYNIYISILFFIGMLGVFITRKNIIIILMCIELMLLAVNMNFICILYT
jgi:NADH-quinone oxidoreductase subunit K